MTTTRVPALLAGMMGYRVIWAALKSMVLLLAGAALGMSVTAAHLPLALLIIGLITLAYTAVGLVGATLFLLFRTVGPITNGVIAISMLLGGVYYPTHVIPSWLQHLSAVVPLTYGLRALRQSLLEGARFADVAADVGALALLTLVLLCIGSAAFGWALSQARRTGGLSQY